MQFAGIWGLLCRSRTERRVIETFLHFKGFLSNRARHQQQPPPPLWKVLSGHNKPKVKRGIVEQCCHKPCSIYHLQRYCDWLITPWLAPLIACKKSISGENTCYVLSTKGNKASWPITQGSSLQRCEFLFCGNYIVLKWCLLALFSCPCTFSCRSFSAPCWLKASHVRIYLKDGSRWEFMFIYKKNALKWENCHIWLSRSKI